MRTRRSCGSSLVRYQPHSLARCAALTDRAGRHRATAAGPHRDGDGRRGRPRRCGPSPWPGRATPRCAGEVRPWAPTTRAMPAVTVVGAACRPDRRGRRAALADRCRTTTVDADPQCPRDCRDLDRAGQPSPRTRAQRRLLIVEEERLFADGEPEAITSRVVYAVAVPVLTAPDAVVRAGMTVVDIAGSVADVTRWSPCQQVCGASAQHAAGGPRLDPTGSSPDR